MDSNRRRGRRPRRARPRRAVPPQAARGRPRCPPRRSDGGASPVGRRPRALVQRRCSRRSLPALPPGAAARQRRRAGARRRPRATATPTRAVAPAAPAPARPAPASPCREPRGRAPRPLAGPRRVRAGRLVTVLRTSARKQAETRGAEQAVRLDTNVLMHDPTALFRFQEHDVYLPMMTLEELDTHKRGMSEVSRNARQVSRTLDSLIAGADGALDQGIVLSRLGNTRSHRPALPPDRGPVGRPAGGPADRQGRQPDPVGGLGLSRASRPQGRPGVEGHQHADQGPCARASPPRTISATRSPTTWT